MRGLGADDGNEPPPDLVELTDVQLIAEIRRLEEARRVGRERAGRMLAELHRRGRLSWPAIARETGLRQTTAYELAERYRTADDPVEGSPK